MDQLPFRAKPKVVDLTSSRKLADKVCSLAPEVDLLLPPATSPNASAAGFRFGVVQSIIAPASAYEPLLTLKLAAPAATGSPGRVSRMRVRVRLLDPCGVA